jgi:pectate lyase
MNILVSMNINTRLEILHPLIVLGPFVFAPTFASAAVPAFPGAQGGGAASVGGRGGAVIEVTNLNDSGAGSLRACMLATGPRTCVFRVGGTINLLSSLRITKPYLSLAGQTAPGGGILLSGKDSSENMVVIATNDVIFRYIRVRKGYNGGCDDECGANIIMGVESYNIIVDHTSSTWNQDEGIGNSASVRAVTISWNLVGEGIRSTAEWHSTGILFRWRGPGEVRRDNKCRHASQPDDE